MSIQNTKKKSRLWLWVALVVLALLIIGAIYKGKTRNVGEVVQSEKVSKRTILETVSASGKIYPEKEVKISSDVSGEVVELYVKEGDSVKIGQLLARINPDIYKSAVERGVAGLNTAKSQKSVNETQINASEASVEQAKAQLENARKSFNRSKQLFTEGVIAQADLDNASVTLKQAEAALKSAESNLRSTKESAFASKYGIQSSEASLKELKTNLARTSIYAPVSGIISKLNIEKGERVLGTIQMAGTEIMRIANLHAMEVQVEVSENDILQVALNQTAEVEVDAYLGKKFKGIVTEIANSYNNSGQVVLNSDQVTNFIVKVSIDPSSYAHILKPGNKFPFRPGMSASVDILTAKEENILAIPIQAVSVREEESSKDKIVKSIQEIVYLVKGDTVAQQEVTTGIQDDNFIYIKSGLNEGDEIVSGPYSAISRKLKSGAKIKVDNNKTNKKED